MLNTIFKTTYSKVVTNRKKQRRYKYSMVGVYISPNREIINKVGVSPISDIDSQSIKDTIHFLTSNLEKTHDFFLPPQYDTSPKIDIMSMITTKVISLLNGDYEYSRGENSTLLLGAKGIGKTTTLLSISITLSLLSEKLVPIYIQYVSDEYRVKTPSCLISEALKSRGLIDQTIERIDEITQILIKHDLRVLLIVDELDQLYQTESTKDCALETLSQLAHLGSDASGRYCIIGCGSSSALPLLITKHAVHIPSLVLEYPLVEKSPNLNGSKFISHKLGIGMMTNDELDIILKDKLGDGNIEEKDRSLFRLFAGPNLRTIGNISRSLKLSNKGNRINNIKAISEYIEPYSKKDSRALETKDCFGVLINNTYNLLLEKNRTIIEGTKEMDLDDLLNIDWKNMISLNRKDLEDIIKRTKESDTNVRLEDYFKLVDSNWFIADEVLDELYPQTPFHMVWENARPSPNKGKLLVNKLSNSIKERIEKGEILKLIGM